MNPDTVTHTKRESSETTAGKDTTHESSDSLAALSLVKIIFKEDRDVII